MKEKGWGIFLYKYKMIKEIFLKYVWYNFFFVGCVLVWFFVVESRRFCVDIVFIC